MSDFKFPATLTGGGFRSTITAYREGASSPLYTASSNHPNFDNIVAGLRAGDPAVWDLFDVKSGVLSRFHQVSDRYAFDGENVLFDGDPVHSTFTDLLKRSLEEGVADNYTALARFGEKLASNPNLHSREQAYDWLACHQFQITEDGDIVGYKGVNDKGNGLYESTAHSQVAQKPSAFVNGSPIKSLSAVPQRVGDVVTMPRSEVAHDPREACKRGLHVSTRSYAASFGNTTLVVFVNPRDVVSVPTDGAGEKVRACRYVVGAVLEDRHSEPSTKPVLRDGVEGYQWTGDVGYKV